MKTKTKTPKHFMIADNSLVLYGDTLYQADLDSFKTALEKSVDDDGYALDDYPSAKVADVKKIVAILAGIEKAITAIDNAKAKLQDFTVFNENPIIDSDGDLTVGCTYVSIDDAKAFVKKL